MFYKTIQNVPFNILRHNELPCYKKEGYGGEHISKWPVYLFFSLYHRNRQETAMTVFTKWYDEQLQRYSNIKKTKGGMYKGSLYKLVEKKSGLPFHQTDIGVIHDAIQERVEQRFKLLCSIKEKGYNKNTELVEGYWAGECIYLLGGHHRAAALLVLGHKSFPEIKVYKNKIFYKIIQLLRRIKYALFKQR